MEGLVAAGDPPGFALEEFDVVTAARLAFEQPSRPLAEVVRDINKFSNNVMAQQLFLTLATTSVPPPATPAKSADAAVVAAHGIIMAHRRRRLRRCRLRSSWG